MAVRVTALLWAVVVNSAGILADGYDLMVIDLVMATLNEMHPEQLGAKQKAFMASMTYVGIISGMIVFGLAADLLGHKVAGLMTAACATVGCSLAACCSHSDAFSIAYQLGLCRFLLGLGIGGEYPVSMTLGSGKKTGNLFREAGLALTSEQILMINLVLFQLGGLGAPALGAIMFNADIHLDIVWRVLVIVGIFPAVAAFIARLLMPSHGVESSEEDAAASPCKTASTGALVSWASARSLARGIGWRFPILLGCCLTWAFHNFVYFGQGSFRSLMDQRIFGSNFQHRAALAHHAHFGFLMTLFGVFSVTMCLVFANKMSLFWGQLISFISFSVLAGLCSLCLGPLAASDGLLFALMCIWTMPLTAAGVFTYVIPTQHFPARIHATCCGIAAAAAKAGALVGTALFPVIEQADGLSCVLLVSCLVGIAGTIATAILTPKRPPKPGELEESKPLAEAD